MNNIKCINTDCPNFSSEHRWNCSTYKDCCKFIPEQENIKALCPREDCIKEENMYCKQISCVKKDCINILDEDYNFRTESKYDSKGCIHYKKKEYKCNTTTCIHYSMELNGCDLTYVPLKTLGVCSAYVTEPIKESTCSHCGESLESETSLIIARRFRSSLKYMYGEKFKSIDKMAENYEEAIIDAVEDEQRRIVRLIIDLNTPADTSYTKWSEIKNIIIPIIQGEIK